jgi:hypothetical protein
MATARLASASLRWRKSGSLCLAALGDFARQDGVGLGEFGSPLDHQLLDDGGTTGEDEEEGP